MMLGHALFPLWRILKGRSMPRKLFFFRSSFFINILLINNNNLDRARNRTLEHVEQSEKKRTGNNSALLLVIGRYHVEIGIKY